MSETPLNPDELAAAYLKSRDVPCPNCAYNRRGGVTSACPECGHVLDIIHESGGRKRAFDSLASRVLTILLILCFIHAIMTGHSLFLWLTFAINGGMPGMIVYVYLITETIGLIAYLTLFVYTLRTRSKARTSQSITPEKTTSPMLIYLVVSSMHWLVGILSLYLQ